MDTSDSYLVMEKMIRLGEIASTELENLLAVLEGQGLLSREEHQALLELAEARDADSAAAR